MKNKTQNSKNYKYNSVFIIEPIKIHKNSPHLSLKHSFCFFVWGAKLLTILTIVIFGVIIKTANTPDFTQNDIKVSGKTKTLKKHPLSAKKHLSISTKAKRYAKKLIGIKNYKYFAYIINRESGWNPMATNGKYFGLGQLGFCRNTNYKHQIRHTLKYIKSRYGTIYKSYLHSKMKGWY